MKVGRVKFAVKEIRLKNAEVASKVTIDRLYGLAANAPTVKAG